MDYHEWGLSGLFLISFLSATVLPFPSEALFLYFLSQNYSPIELLLVATLGNSLGGLTTFLLGVFGHRLKPPKLKMKWVEYAERYGFWCAFFSWVPIIGDPLLLFLGYIRTKTLPTIMLMVLGKFLRYLVLAFPFI